MVQLKDKMDQANYKLKIAEKQLLGETSFIYDIPTFTMKKSIF